MMNRRTRKHWSLFVDWCTSTRREALPATLDTVGAFIHDCPAGESTLRERIRAIIVAHDDAGTPLQVPARVDTPRTAWRVGTEPTTQKPWLGLDDALACTNPYAYPAGIAARRDAFLTALVGACGLSLSAASSLRPTDLSITGGAVTVRGGLVPVAAASEECPSCAVVRWLNVLGAWSIQWSLGGHGYGVDAIFEQVTADLGGEHECRQGPVNGWGLAGVLSPVLERGMFPAFSLEPLSRAAVRNAVRACQHPNRLSGRRRVATTSGNQVPASLPEGEEPNRRGMSVQQHRELDALFDDIDARIDTILNAARFALGEVGEGAD